MGSFPCLLGTIKDVERSTAIGFVMDPRSALMVRGIGASTAQTSTTTTDASAKAHHAMTQLTKLEPTTRQ